MARSTQNSPYLDKLLSLPFLTKATLQDAAKSTISGPDAVLQLTTPRGSKKLLVEMKRSHLSRALVRDLIARASARTQAPLILFAPYVSPEMATLLVSSGINFVDRAGNCYVDLGGDYIGHIQGRRLRLAPEAPSGIRGPGFRLVFALLVEPNLLNAPARETSRLAGVSLGTVSNVLRTLERDRILVSTKSRRHLVSRDELVERWVSGYADTLRPRLYVGRFRTPDKNTAELETRLTGLLGQDATWAWGGAAAAFRLTQHYRSEETVLHVATPLSELPRRLKGLPHREGQLTVLGAPGPLAFRGVAPRTVHPLLIYSELLLSGSDRAKEAASEIRERFLRP